MYLFRFGKRAVDIENQRAGVRNQVSHAGRADGRERFVHRSASVAPVPFENTRLARTSPASIAITSSAVSMRSRFATMRLAWRNLIRSSALRIERALENRGCALRAAM